MKFEFLEGDDVVKYTVIKDGIKKSETDKFRFMGFQDTIHPFFKRQVDFAAKALKSRGIILNITTVPTVDDMFINNDKDYIDNEDLRPFVSKLEKSEDGNFYGLLRDEEMGNGWAILYKVMDDKIEIIRQEHRSTVREEIVRGDFIRSFGVDYSYLYDNELARAQL